eukprot:1162049-Pelagomonas_calceolata.AAC.2
MADNPLGSHQLYFWLPCFWLSPRLAVSHINKSFSETLASFRYGPTQRTTVDYRGPVCDSLARETTSPIECKPATTEAAQQQHNLLVQEL